MATFNKAKLSGSTDGMAIKVTGTATGSTVTVHTAVAGTTAGVFENRSRISAMTARTTRLSLAGSSIFAT